MKKNDTLIIFKMISLTDIQNILRGNIAVDEPMAKHTWMKVGGPADFYIEPADKNDLIALIDYFQYTSLFMDDTWPRQQCACK